MKINKKIISLAIAFVMTFTPVLGTAHAADLETPIEELESMSSQDIEEVVNSIEDNFHEKYGNSDEFKIVSEDDKVKTEINGAKGVIRVTSYENGEITKTESIDFLDNLQEVEKEEINSLSTLSRSKSSSATVLSKTTTGGPDPFSIYVETNGRYKSDFKIVVTGWNGFKDSYYKDGSWKSGNTEKFYDAILAGADNIDDIKSNARNAAAYISIKALLKKYIGPGALIPGYEELRAALDALGLGFSTEEVVRNSIAYCINLGQCQYYLNRL